MALSEQLQLGKAGEYRVLSELILRGASPALTCVDNGIDLVLENGKRIQVKTSNKPQFSKSNGNGYKLKNPSEYYAFSLRHGKKGKKLEYNFDFLIVWIIPLNRFYIIPKEDVKDIKTILINKKEEISNSPGGINKYQARFVQYKDRWELLK